MFINKLQRKLIDISRNLINLPQANTKHFTYICRRNKIVCFGVNKAWQTHPIALKFGARFSAIHSELAAILNFPLPISELVHFDMYNVRLHKNGDVALSKPCDNCMELLTNFGIQKLKFTTSEGFSEIKLW